MNEIFEAALHVQHRAPPPPPPRSAEATVKVKVKVPRGAAPGDTIEFALSRGRTANLVIPQGAHAGMVVTCNVVAARNVHTLEVGAAPLGNCCWRSHRTIKD